MATPLFTPEIGIRVAHMQDINRLCAIYRDSFKQGLRSLIPFYFTRLRWKLRLSTRSVEVWVAEVNGEVAGFCVIIVDEIQWRRDQNGSLLLRIGHLAALLQKGISQIVRSVSMCASSRKLQGKEKEGGFSTPYEHVTIQPVAVAMDRRRLGLAKLLLRWSERRARELKRRAIRLSVDSNNFPACRLYEALGYRLITDGVSLRKYVKVLDGDDNDV